MGTLKSHGQTVTYVEGILDFSGDVVVGKAPCTLELACPSNRIEDEGGSQGKVLCALVKKEGTYCSTDPRTPSTGTGGMPKSPTVSHTATALILIFVTPSWYVSRVYPFYNKGP